MANNVASNTTKSLIVLSKVKGVGKKTLSYLARDKAFSAAPRESWGSYVREFSALPESSQADSFAAAEKELEICEQLGIKVFSAADEEYPLSFRKIPDAPALIYCKGNHQLLRERCLTIIGTREPTPMGVESAKRITSWFSDEGWVIVSGLAVGIDATAHKQCLNSNGKTIAVLAHGLEKVYPAENKDLASEILDKGGLLLSEYAPHSRVFKSSFVERDRLQAGLGSATILVQTGVQGGSLHASRASLVYDRLLVVVNPLPSDIEIGHEKIQGNLKIINSRSQDELAQYMKCPSYLTKNIKVLRSREDYLSINHQLLEVYRGLGS